MKRNILVTYASKYGATKEIADKIGEVLHQAGLQADVLPINGIQDLKQYNAFILGSAIYIGKWHKDAVVFLKKNEKILTDMPIWLFSSGPTGKGDPVKLFHGLRLPANLQPIADCIQPRDIAVFNGYINPEKINFIEKWSIKSLVKKPMGDFRDWDSIVTWARRIVVALNGAKSSQLGIDHV